VCDAVGASYPKHVDNGGGGDPRLLTAIVYLAAPPAGGAFRAYAPTADARTEIAPRPGTLVAFWADRLVHDVAAVEECRGPDDARWALTVWLCADDAAVVEPTPPAVLAHHFPGA
jgi:Rps23 Pro-64 3,4-dihydroxylase Tpa1-like proline 4-hydroxylase